MNNWTDTHCHVLPEEYQNYNEILKALEKNNLKRIIVNGYDLESNKNVLKLVDQYPNVYGALGLHPDNIEFIIPHFPQGGKAWIITKTEPVCVPHEG